MYLTCATFSHLGDVAFLQQDKLPVVRRGTKVSAELSMPYTYTSYFVGTKGRHVKPLVEKYNVTKFCIKPSSNYKMSAMSFVIESSDSSEFTRELQSRAEQVVLKREQHFNKVQVSKRWDIFAKYTKNKFATRSYFTLCDYYGCALFFRLITAGDDSRHTKKGGFPCSLNVRNSQSVFWDCVSRALQILAQLHLQLMCTECAV